MAQRVSGTCPDESVQRWLLLMRGFLEVDHDRSCELLWKAARLGREAGEADVELLGLP